jgi:serine/threonine protein kinase
MEYVKAIGEGYFCNVALYKTGSAGNYIARKKLKRKLYDDADNRNRLKREIKLLDELKDCPFIIKTIENGEDEENKELWYTMPYATKNLHDYIAFNNASLPHTARYEIAEQVILAIKYAHDRKILHRDISPSNVMVFDNGEKIDIKVSDFGLGKNQDSLTHYTHSSASGYGQILYVSPEQLDKLKSATEQSDIFSLGKLLYYIFTGKLPQDLKPCELSTLITKATDESPMKRFKSVDELYEHFLQIKTINLNTEISDEYLTIREILKDGNKPWLVIHKLFVKGEYHNHVYTDYLAPVVSLLNANNIKEYYGTVGGEIKTFAQTFENRLEECLNSIGWPFDEAASFGHFLSRMMRIVDDKQTRLICLKGLWTLAFVRDRWSAQSQIKDFLNPKYIDPTIEGQFAEFIKAANVEVELNKLPIDVPRKIKITVIEINKGHEEKRSNTKADENNISPEY